MEIPELSDIIVENITVDSPNSWKPNKFRKIIETINTYPKEILDEHEALINELKNKILSELSFIKHLVNEDSPFVKAMIEGSWVNLDGIEKAQPELAERILSLCDPINPYLNLFEKGSDYYYSRTATNPKFKIHENFRLFMTYNSLDVDPSKKLGEGFLNKNVVFSLFENDESNISSGLVLSGLFKQNGLFTKNKGENESGIKLNATEMAARFANVHQYAKNLSKNEIDKFAGKKQFSGRTMNFVFNSLNNREDFNEQVISAIEDCYSVSYDNPEELKNRLLKVFCEDPSVILKNNINKNENEAEQKYSEINELLESLTNPKTKLDFNLLVQLIGSCEYKFLGQLKNKISETQKKIIDKKVKDYSLLQIIQNLIGEFLKRDKIIPKIKESFKVKQISKPSMSNENYLKYAQGKYLLLYALLKNDFIFSMSYKNIDNYLKESNSEENENPNLIYELAEKGENSNDLLSQALSIIYSYPELYEEISYKKEDDKKDEAKEGKDEEKSLDSKSNKSNNTHKSGKSKSKSSDSKSSKSSVKSRSKSKDSKKSGDSGKSRSNSRGSKISKSSGKSRSNSKDSKNSAHSGSKSRSKSGSKSGSKSASKSGSKSKKSGESEKSKSVSKDSKKLDKKIRRNLGEPKKDEEINIKTEKNELNKDKKEREGGKEDEIKLKKEDFQGKYKELKLKEGEENKNLESEKKIHIDIDKLNLKGFKKICL